MPSTQSLSNCPNTNPISKVQMSAPSISAYVYKLWCKLFESEFYQKLNRLNIKIMEVMLNISYLRGFNAGNNQSYLSQIL
jgi:hypothetical protein